MLLTIAINSILVAGTVLIHYEALRLLSAWLGELPIRARLRIVVGIFGALFAHVIEIWLFGIAYHLMTGWGMGDLQGNVAYTLMDSVYFSFTTYSSLGLGDVEPTGNIRFLAGLEALTGLVMITWTASFLYIEMSRYWQNDIK